MFRTELPPKSVLVAAGFGALHLIDDNLVEPGPGLRRRWPPHPT
jgi:hypothetical protein